MRLEDCWTQEDCDLLIAELEAYRSTPDFPMVNDVIDAYIKQVNNQRRELPPLKWLSLIPEMIDMYNRLAVKYGKQPAKSIQVEPGRLVILTDTRIKIGNTWQEAWNWLIAEVEKL